MRNIVIDAERRYENSKVLDTDVRKSQGKYYWATALPTDRHVEDTIAWVKGKRVLEVGCSAGEMAKLYTSVSASFVGVDIADEAIKAAQDKHLVNAEFYCCDAHKLPFPDSDFDAVVVNSLLHHLDLEVALAEISRVLTDEGILIFREPLGTNPLFQLYRLLTPSARTEDERPFTFADIRLMSRFFNFKHTNWFGFTNILSAFMRAPSLRNALTNLDQVLGKTVIRHYFWQFCGVATKQTFKKTSIDLV